MSRPNERKGEFKLKEQTTVEIIFKRIRQSLDSSTLHLVPNIVKSKHLVVKIFLALCFLASTVVCILFLIQSFTNFDVITSIRTNYLISMTFPFPVVMICKAKAYNQNLTNLVRGCKFSYKECDYQHDFSLLKDPIYGDCFQFNSGKNMNGKKVEKKKTNQAGYLNMYLSRKDKNDTVRVFIGYQIASSRQGSPIYLAPGQLHRIVLSKTITQQYPKPFSNC